MRAWFSQLSQAKKYGLVVFAAIFAVGFITGMGGSFLPNLIFSALMGLLAGVLYSLAQKYANRNRN